jgi:hypothetical protein
MTAVTSPFRRLTIPRKTKRPGLSAGALRSKTCILEPVPQELVVTLVVELHLLAFDERAQPSGTAVGGGLFQEET